MTETFSSVPIVPMPKIGDGTFFQPKSHTSPESGTTTYNVDKTEVAKISLIGNKPTYTITNKAYAFYKEI